MSDDARGVMNQTRQPLTAMSAAYAARMAGASASRHICELLVEAAREMGAASAAVSMIEGDELILVSAAGHDVAERARLACRPIASSAGLPIADGDHNVGVLDLDIPAPRSEEEEDLAASLEFLLHVAGAAVGRARRAEAIEERLRHEQRLLSAVCQDVRIPLGSIAACAEQLQVAGQVDMRGRVQLHRIAASAEAARWLLADLLDRERSEPDEEITIDRRPGDLFRTLGQAVAEARLRAPDRAFSIAVQGTGAGAWDAGRAGWIFTNLLSWAAAHAYSGTPIEVVADGRHDHRVYIEVRCQRPVIQAEHIGRLFQAPPDGAERGPHCAQGLELFLARQLAFAHGGRVWATSSEADGTVFTVELPRAVGEPAAPRSGAAVAPHMTAPAAAEPSTPPYRALLSRFHDPALARLLRHWLALGGGDHLPHPARVDRVLLADLLPEMFFAHVERDPEGRVELRYQEVGGALERLLGHGLAGRIVPRPGSGGGLERAGYHAALRSCVELVQPIYNFASISLGGLLPVRLERLTLPLSRDGGRRITDIFGVARFSHFTPRPPVRDTSRGPS